MDRLGESVQPKPETREIRPAKTLWDWLQLFIVPLALVLIGLAFSVQQDARQQQTEAKRAEAERELANQRAQDEALQAYLDQMGSLLLEKDLRHSKEHSEVRTLARARTLTVLRRVNRSRKNEIMHFLVDAGLVHRVGESAPVIELRRINLSGINLNNANLRGAILKKATLIGSHLSGADLSEANLSHSHLRRADLSGINLNNANLNEAKLSKAKLKEADLSGVFGLTDEQTTAATTLEGATMPNGQQYEDWLKDKKAQGKDVKNE